MGEYATYQGESVKIGTCEDMLYLRWDQRHDVAPESGSLDPADQSIEGSIRFRFPWPDEDQIAPGQFADPFRSLALHGVALPGGLEHGLTQFTARAGYVMSIPCPEGMEGVGDGFHAADFDVCDHPVRVHRNGFAGAFKLVQQAVREGKLVGIGECGGCGRRFWMSQDVALAAADALLAKAAQARRDLELAPRGKFTPEDIAHAGRFYEEVAIRLIRGYCEGEAWR